MTNPWLKNKRKNWRDNPSMMDLYRQAMMNKYSPYRKMDLQGQDTVFDYPSALWPQSEATVEEPAFIPRGRTPQSREEVQTIVDTPFGPMDQLQIDSINKRNAERFYINPEESATDFVPPGRTPKRKEDVKTVITESEDPEVATKKVTTITGGLMGDVPTGQDDPQNEKGMGMWDADMAQLRARQEQGTAAPTQQAVEGALERYARMRRSQLAPPSRDDEQIAQVDPRIVALNQPPAPAGIPLGYGQDDDAGQPRASSDAAVQGMIQDAMRHGRSKQRADAGYPARDEFSHWPVEEKGILDSLTGPTKWGDSAYADTMIRDQDERENLAEKRKKETGSEHPTLQERLGLTEEAFRWKGENFQKEQAEKEKAKVTGWPGPGLDNPPYGVDSSLPGNLQRPREEVKEAEILEKEDSGLVDANVAQANANQNLWKAWGDYVRKPGERKAAYMKNLSDIFRKAMIMNAVAQFTGGTSQASAYVKFATGKLDAIEKFDQEDRLQSAWKSIMFNEDGTFNPPAGYGEALERAAKLGVSPKESKAFSALFPKAATSKFWVYDTKAKKNIRITDDQYIKDDGRYTATADAGGRATQAAIVDIPYYFDDAGLDAEEQADVMMILQTPNAIMELWKKYPELMKLYKKKEDETSASGLYGLNALTSTAGRQQEGTQEATGSQQGSEEKMKILEVEK